MRIALALGSLLALGVSAYAATEEASSIARTDQVAKGTFSLQSNSREGVFDGPGKPRNKPHSSDGGLQGFASRVSQFKAANGASDSKSNQSLDNDGRVSYGEEDYFNSEDVAYEGNSTDITFDEQGGVCVVDPFASNSEPDTSSAMERFLPPAEEYNSTNTGSGLSEALVSSTRRITSLRNNSYLSILRQYPIVFLRGVSAASVLENTARTLLPYASLARQEFSREHALDLYTPVSDTARALVPYVPSSTERALGFYSPVSGATNALAPYSGMDRALVPYIPAAQTASWVHAVALACLGIAGIAYVARSVMSEQDVSGPIIEEIKEGTSVDEAKSDANIEPVETVYVSRNYETQALNEKQEQDIKAKFGAVYSKIKNSKVVETDMAMRRPGESKEQWPKIDLTINLGSPPKAFYEIEGERIALDLEALYKEDQAMKGAMEDLVKSYTQILDQKRNEKIIEELEKDYRGQTITLDLEKLTYTVITHVPGQPDRETVKNLPPEIRSQLERDKKSHELISKVDGYGHLHLLCRTSSSTQVFSTRLAMKMQERSWTESFRARPVNPAEEEYGKGVQEAKEREEEILYTRKYLLEALKNKNASENNEGILKGMALEKATSNGFQGVYFTSYVMALRSEMEAIKKNSSQGEFTVNQWVADELKKVTSLLENPERSFSTEMQKLQFTKISPEDLKFNEEGKITNLPEVQAKEIKKDERNRAARQLVKMAPLAKEVYLRYQAKIENAKDKQKALNDAFVEVETHAMVLSGRMHGQPKSNYERFTDFISAAPEEKKPLLKEEMQHVLDAFAVLAEDEATYRAYQGLVQEKSKGLEKYIAQSVFVAGFLAKEKLPAADSVSNFDGAIVGA